MSGSENAWASRAGDWWTIAAWAAAGCAALAVALLPLPWAALFVVGTAVALLTLIRPQFGVLLILVAVPFGSLRQVQVGAMSLDVTELLVALTLTAWAMRMVARREVRLRPSGIAVALLLFLGAMLLSLSVPTKAQGSLEYGLKEMVKWGEVLAVYLCVSHEVNERWALTLMITLMGIGALAALQGIYQFLFRVGPEGFVLFDRFMRAYGTFEQPNPYGGYMGLTLPLAIGFLLGGALPVGARVRSLWLLLAGVCGTLMTAALIMSWSRGAWMGVAAAVLVMTLALLARRSRVTWVAVATAALAAYLVLAGGVVQIPPSIAQRFSDFVPYLGTTDVRGMEITDANYAVLERMAHWQAALSMWTDHPWLGVGVGNYEPLYPRYALPMWPAALGHAHNYYLNIAAETGLVGLAAYVLVYGMGLAGAWQATRVASGWRWGAALGILGVLTHLGVHNGVDNLYVHGMYLQIAVLLGVVPILSRGLHQVDAHSHGH